MARTLASENKKRRSKGAPSPASAASPAKKAKSSPKKKGVRVSKKRALSPYNLFMRQGISETRRKHPKMCISDIFAQVAHEWKAGGAPRTRGHSKGYAL